MEISAVPDNSSLTTLSITNASRQQHGGGSVYRSSGGEPCLHQGSRGHSFPVQHQGAWGEQKLDFILWAGFQSSRGRQAHQTKISDVSWLQGVLNRIRQKIQKLETAIQAQREKCRTPCTTKCPIPVVSGEYRQQNTFMDWNNVPRSRHKPSLGSLGSR